MDPEAARPGRDIDYLVVGHIAKDVMGRGFTLGGSAVYSALAAARLGRRVAAVTACQPGVDLQRTLPATSISFAPSLTSTVFENIYRPSGGRSEREQYLHSRAADLQTRHIPPSWRASRLVHLAPIAQELAPDVVDLFGGAFIGLTVQGWLRGWDHRGKVFFKPWAAAAEILPKLSAVVLSEEDVGQREDAIDYFAALVPVLAVTLGDRGARVHWADPSGEGWKHFPALPTREVDPTGAGDVFAAAFFHRLEETGEPGEAAVFANCAASFAVEAPGLAGIPTLAMVERRLRGAKWPKSSQ